LPFGCVTHGGAAELPLELFVFGGLYGTVLAGALDALAVLHLIVEDRPAVLADEDAAAAGSVDVRRVVELLLLPLLTCSREPRRLLRLRLGRVGVLLGDALRLLAAASPAVSWVVRSPSAFALTLTAFWRSRLARLVRPRRLGFRAFAAAAEALAVSDLIPYSLRNTAAFNAWFPASLTAPARSARRLSLRDVSVLTMF
jgi:hypothetical protein